MAGRRSTWQNKVCRARERVSQERGGFAMLVGVLLHHKWRSTGELSASHLIVFVLLYQIISKFNMKKLHNDLISQVLHHYDYSLSNQVGMS